MIAFGERLRVAVDVVKDQRDQVSKVSLLPATPLDVGNKPFEARSIPDSATAVASRHLASRGFVNPKNDFFCDRD